ncbi:hypothetical protein J4209_07020, partial [Candidatus Woesearchaeota archaeon]|nr:hypothetical protein [Candidatus Woesearchaeota archaeon]
HLTTSNKSSLLLSLELFFTTRNTPTLVGVVYFLFPINFFCNNSIYMKDVIITNSNNGFRIGDMDIKLSLTKTVRSSSTT